MYAVFIWLTAVAWKPSSSSWIPSLAGNFFSVEAVLASSRRPVSSSLFADFRNIHFLVDCCVIASTDQAGCFDLEKQDGWIAWHAGNFVPRC
jgi:hypothetical protein